MRLFDKLAKFAGKNDFTIDENIDKRYVFGLCIKYGSMKIRGLLKSIFCRNIPFDIYIGKKVKMISKNHLTIGRKVKIHDNVKIDALAKEGVLIGDNVVIGYNCIIECTGTVREIGKGIKIGNRTTFGNNCFFGAAGGIEIGDDVICGQYVRFHSENHIFDNKELLIREQGVSHKGIKIGSNCWIGAGATFLDGSEVGDGCVIAANSVVTKKFGNNVVIGGIPAKIIKER